MSEYPIKVVKVTGRLTRSGFNHSHRHFQANETPKVYVTKNGSRINKSKLMSIQTNTHETPLVMIYHTYCIDGDQQKALDLLKAHIVAKAQEYKKITDEIYAHLPK